MKFQQFAFAAALTFAFLIPAHAALPELGEDDAAKIDAALPDKSALAAPKKPRKILVFTRTQGYVHADSIVAAKRFYKNAETKLGLWNAVISEDLSMLEHPAIDAFDAVVLAQSTRNPFGLNWENLSKLPESEQKKVLAREDAIIENLRKFVQNGKGLVALHAGIDAYNYKPILKPKFLELVGGNFIGHPYCQFDTQRKIARLDDTKSPVTRGIFKTDHWSIPNEIYMMGEYFDRSKCRVLISLDTLNSEIAREPWLSTQLPIRRDRDIPVVWIKSEGSGRVAYDGFFHSGTDFFDKNLQTLHARIVQFAAGDINADTSSIPQSTRNCQIPFYKLPSPECIAKARAADYGKKTEELNRLYFSILNHTRNAAFCKKTASFIVSELAARNGSEAYRAMLAETLWAFPLNFTQRRILDSVLADSRTESAVSSRIKTAEDCVKVLNAKPDGKFSFSVPQNMPADRRTLMRTIKYLGANPEEKIPAYLEFGKLPNYAKTAFLHMAVKRGFKSAELLNFKPFDRDSAVAYAYYASKFGNATHIPAILEASEFVSAPIDKRVIAERLDEIKDTNASEALRALKTAQGQVAEIVAIAVSQTDVEDALPSLFANFADLIDAAKIGVARTAQSVATPAAFRQLCAVLPAEKNAKVRASLEKAMLKCIQDTFTKKMFEDLKTCYNACDENGKEPLLRLMNFDGSDEAVSICFDAYKTYPDAALKALGLWKNPKAFNPLLKIAKEADSDRTRTVAVIAMLSVAKRSQFSAPALEYILKNAPRQSDKQAAVEIAKNRLTPQISEILKSAGFSDAAKKAE